jgi:hypothetical protein
MKNTPDSNYEAGPELERGPLWAASGLPYQSPHKFRHGHAVYALQHSDTMADYKAVSMNLMHADIRVTDSVYATLASEEVKRRIARLTPSVSSPRSDRAADLLDSLSNAELAQLLSVAAERLAG